MKTEVFQGTLTAVTPIHHGGSETYGTIRPILTLPTLIRDEDGGFRVEDVPYIHGNAIRGYLRRLLMQDFLDLLDYELTSAKIFHFLFTGGLLESKDGGSVDMRLRTSLRKYLPPVSLLGSALGNQMLQGKLKVGLAEPVCSELRWRQEELYGDVSAYNLRARDYGTRLDSLREYKEDRAEGEQAHQMKYEFEVLIPGTVFLHEFILTDADAVERACFIRALNLWRERPYIGGKSSAGYGKLRLDYDYNPGDESEYIEYLQEKGESVCRFLDELTMKWK